MYASCTLDWRLMVGWVCECDLYSDLYLTGNSHNFCMTGWFLCKVLHIMVMIRGQVPGSIMAARSFMFSPLVSVGFFSLVSSLRPKLLTVKLKLELWLMMKICVRLPGTAGLLLVNHHGEHLHRQISTSERSSKTARYGPVASCLEWNGLNWPSRALMCCDSLHFL